MRWYPCDFTEVHAFEIDRQLLKLPEVEFAENDNVELPNPRAIISKQTPGIPNWMLQRMTVYNQFVSDADDDATKAVNITRFIKEKRRWTSPRPTLWSWRWISRAPKGRYCKDGWRIRRWLTSSTSFSWRFISSILPCPNSGGIILLQVLVIKLPTCSLPCALKASSCIPGLDAALTMGGFVDPCCITSKLHSSSHLIHLSYSRSSNGLFLQFEVFSLQQGAYHGKLSRMKK